VALSVVPGEETGQSLQAEWMKRQLDRRSWTIGEATTLCDLDWHTAKKALGGLYVSPGSWKKIIDVLNTKPIGGHDIDIEDVPRTEKPPKRKAKESSTPTRPETS
jgi:hypothetical protein